jgi:hypothetical protein
MAIPRLLRLALRNIPALIAAAVFIYLISQRATGLESSEQPVPAGE